MPIDSPHLFTPHGPSQDWRRLSELKAPKIPPSSCPVASRTGSTIPLYGQSQDIGPSTAISPRSSTILATHPCDEPIGTAQASRQLSSHRKRSSTHLTPRAPDPKPKTKPPTPSPVRVAPVNGKGQGIFASKPMQAGTTILRERPFITFQDPLTSLEVYTALAALPPDSRDIFWSFSGRGAHTPMDVDIAETNLIPLDGDEACGMFVTICRINHCCSPNARWIWSSKEGKMAVRALCDIEIDEEITVSYLDPDLLISPKRIGWIESLFHFDCRCRTCTSPDMAESDANRELVKTAFERWETQPIDEWFYAGLSPELNKSETIKEMDQVERIIKQECLTMFLPQLLEYRFQLHAAWGEYEDAKRVGRQWEAEEHTIGERKGAGGEEVSRIRKDPRKWGQWGQLKKLSSRLNKVKPVKKAHQYGRKAAG